MFYSHRLPCHGLFLVNSPIPKRAIEWEVIIDVVAMHIGKYSQLHSKHHIDESVLDIFQTNHAALLLYLCPTFVWQLQKLLNQ